MNQKSLTSKTAQASYFEEAERKLNDLLHLDIEPVKPSARTRVLPSQTVKADEAICDLSFIFFSDVSSSENENKYKLVFDLAEFADANQFKAVWFPERHFHPFGGIYPNPAVLASAIAQRTQNIRLRAGSVVLPLHHPAEVVESWSMVDNLSDGRVDLGVASGWNPNDFLLSPDTFANNREIWHERIKIVQDLWQGKKASFLNGKGEPTEINVYPEPKQKQLNIWLTATKLDESFIYAGKMGYNVLTMLQGVDMDEMGRKIGLYRDARRQAGFAPEEGCVTLMLHTLVHENIQHVEQVVREPFQAYIKSALRGHMNTVDKDKRPSEKELDKMVEYSFERYFKTGALFGSIDDCVKTVKKAVSVGVDEIACLMDFGIEYSSVMESLPYLRQLTAKVKVLGKQESVTEMATPA